MPVYNIAYYISSSTGSVMQTGLTVTTIIHIWYMRCPPEVVNSKRSPFDVIACFLLSCVFMERVGAYVSLYVYVRIRRDEHMYNIIVEGDDD